MRTYERGPIQTYEITWVSGHVERIQAHQALMPPLDTGLFGDLATRTGAVRRWTFHAEIDGVWSVVLSAREEDIRTVRNVTREEAAPGAAA